MATLQTYTEGNRKHMAKDYNSLAIVQKVCKLPVRAAMDGYCQVIIDATGEVFQVDELIGRFAVDFDGMQARLSVLRQHKIETEYTALQCTPISGVRLVNTRELSRCKKRLD